MLHRPDESLKTAAAELAHLMYSGSYDRKKMDSLLELLYRPGEVTADPDIRSEEDSDNNEIGIWKLAGKEDNQYYERDAGKRSVWHLWANKNRIPVHSEKRRIILLGESVARGCLYDPYYNVAMELEAILKGSAEMSDCEVIDLAKTSIGMEELRSLMRSSVTLNPAAVVIFAGNNWNSGLRDALTTGDYHKMFGIFHKKLYGGIKEFLEEKFAGLITSFLDETESLFVQHKIPVIFIIPEFNLKDWKSDEVEKILPWMPGDRVSVWLKSREEAEKAMTRDDREAVELHAYRMVQADPFNPLGHELLAEFYLKKGDNDSAREYFENARDCALLRRGNNTNPRCFGIIRKTILSEAPVRGIHLLDLPEVFNEYYKGSIPDRNLFLDYCHLTVQGIKIAMRQTCSLLNRLMNGKDDNAALLAARGVDVSTKVRAVAHFCAAIHNAHYGQSPEIIQYHCLQAASLSDTVHSMMRLYVDFASRYTSSVLCKTLGEIILDGNTQQYEGGLGFTHPHGRKLMDFALTGAMVQALAAMGINISAGVRELRQREHAIDTDKTNLLDSFYSNTSYNDTAIEPRPCFLQVRDTRKNFHFIARGGESINVEMVYRTPARNYPDKAVKLYVNDELVTEAPMSSAWATCTFIINGKFIKEDINNLRIEWPYTFEPFHVRHKIDPNSLLNAMFPVCGEIYSLNMCTPVSEYLQQEEKLPALTVNYFAEK